MLQWFVDNILIIQWFADAILIFTVVADALFSGLPFISLAISKCSGSTPPERPHLVQKYNSSTLTD
jgi:hypothetical protein